MPAAIRALRGITVVLGAALLVTIGAAGAVAQQAYPNATVRVLVPFGAGGATDVMARVFAEFLQQRMGQPFAVENRPGAAGMIAATAFARSAADGYTLMFTTAAPITVAPQLVDKVQYDPRKDFAPVAVVATQPVWFAVHAKSPHNSLGDILNYAKANPGKFTYGTSGVGTELHLAVEALSRSAGVRMVHVPYKGGGAVVAALMGEQVDAAALSTASIAGPVKQGTWRALGVSTPKRLADFPNVPTFAELGHPGATMVPWWGLMAPAGTPEAIVKRLTAELEAATKDAKVRDRLRAAFVQIDFAGPQEFASRLNDEAKLYGDIIRAAKITLKK